MILSRDENRITVGGGASDDANRETMPLLIDPVTGRLLIHVFGNSITTPPAMPDSKFDENRITTGSVIDGTNLKPLLIDNNSGYLQCDVLVE